MAFVPHTNPARIVTRDGFLAEMVGSRNGKEHWRLLTSGFWMDVPRAITFSRQFAEVQEDIDRWQRGVYA